MTINCLYLDIGNKIMVKGRPHKRDFCEVCWKPVSVEHDFDNRNEKAVCSHRCYVIENLFIRLYSNKEYEMRDYFRNQEE